MGKQMGQASVSLGSSGTQAESTFVLSQSVLDYAPIGMLITSADDKIIWANHAMEVLLGVPRPQLVDGAFLPFVHEIDRCVLAEDSEQLLSVQKVAGVREFRWLHHGGGIRWGSLRTAIALGDSGEPLLYGEPQRPCLIRQILDITEKNNAENELARVVADLQERNIELERSNEELTQFAYIASHDLSEPLRVISGHVELLAQRYQGQLDANADRYIAFAVDGCTRMRTLIEDLLRYSRAGREVAFEQVEMFEIMDQVRRNLAAALKASGGSLQVDGELDSVIADKSQLIQVIENLVNNSLKYAKPSVPPEVQVSTSREPGSWRLQIADNGVGIPEEYRHTVFRIFQRLHGREIPGTGIGLAICRKVVERHHGTIEIGDSAYGGAQFTIVLPQREALGDA